MDARNDAGWTPLHCAARMVRNALCSAAICGIFVVDTSSAAIQGNMGVAEILCKSGADIWTRTGLNLTGELTHDKIYCIISFRIMTEF